MNRRKSRLVIFIIILILGMTVSKVLPKESQTYTRSNSSHGSPQKIVEKFFSQEKYLNGFRGNPPVSEIREKFKDKATVGELIKQFQSDCGKSGIAARRITKARHTFCSRAVLTLGVLGLENAKGLIISFLKENTNSNPSARKAGFLALGYLENTRKQERVTSIKSQSRSDPQGQTYPLAPAPPSTLSISREIIRCLPESLLPQGHSKQKNTTDQCRLLQEDQKRKEWDVKKQSERDEIRWGLISLAKSGSCEAKEVLENLKKGSAEGTSRQAFVKELIKLYEKSAGIYGLCG